jgi:hypothetical protein
MADESSDREIEWRCVGGSEEAREMGGMWQKRRVLEKRKRLWNVRETTTAEIDFTGNGRNEKVDHKRALGPEHAKERNVGGREGGEAADGRNEGTRDVGNGGVADATEEAAVKETEKCGLVSEMSRCRPSEDRQFMRAMLEDVEEERKERLSGKDDRRTDRSIFKQEFC